jgi:hypothetical protein
MSDLIHWGTDWLADQLIDHASQTVVYKRGVHQVTLQATFSRKLLKLADEDGIRMQWTDADFLIRRSDLVLNGNETLPQVGDTVRWTHGGLTYVFEVSAPPGEPFWRWSDSFKKIIRVHTKHTKVE